MLIELILGLIAGQLLFYNLRSLPKFKSNEINDTTKVSVIIPAFNEEANLPRLLASLKKQETYIHEIIVVDDQSRDRTYEIATEYNVTVKKSDEKNSEWIGKSRACHEGTKWATGNVYLFVDADTVFLKDAIRTLIYTFENQEGVVSVQPYHSVMKWYEQCSLFFNLILVGAIHSFSLFSSNESAIGLFGPVIMISKAHYDEIGGHAHIKNKVVEDLALGAELKAHHIPRNNYIGLGYIKFKMYESFEQLLEGWIKNFASGARSTHFLIFVLVFMYLCGCFAVGLSLIISINSVIIWIFYFLYLIQIHLIISKIGSFKSSTKWLFPLYLIVFILIFVYSILKTFIIKKVKWKGRMIRL